MSSNMVLENKVSDGQMTKGHDMQYQEVWEKEMSSSQKATGESQNKKYLKQVIACIHTMKLNGYAYEWRCASIYGLFHVIFLK